VAVLDTALAQWLAMLRARDDNGQVALVVSHRRGRRNEQLAVHLAEQGAEFPVGASFPHLFFATAAGVVVIAVDPGDPDVMHRPPRDPKVPITNRTAVLFWLWYAVVVFVATLAPLVVGPDEPSPDRASASMTMTFVVMGLGTVFNALANRRDPAAGSPRRS
jgi:hypothetical protein